MLLCFPWSGPILPRYLPPPHSSGWWRTPQNCTPYSIVSQHLKEKNPVSGVDVEFLFFIFIFSLESTCILLSNAKQGEIICLVASVCCVFNYRPHSWDIIHLVVSVCMCVCLYYYILSNFTLCTVAERAIIGTRLCRVQQSMKTNDTQIHTLL